MKVYVVSGFMFYEGVDGMFDSLEKAEKAINNYCEDNNDEIEEYDTDVTSKYIYTTQGAYVIDRMELNEE